MNKIPKVIHYCWFGGNPLPDMAKKCIESWKKYCPDYEIKEWNEENFDINCCAYVKEAYEAKKWAFVSDVARLYALVHFGGIYMDTDVEVMKPLDDLLQYDGISGFEAEDRIPTGMMACRANHPMFKELLHDYDEAHFIKQDGEYDLTTNVTRITKACLKHGLKLNNTLQTVNQFTLFPQDYFCPKNWKTKILTVTENTYMIHHFDGSWISEEEKYAAKLSGKFERYFSKKVARRIGRVITTVKYKGVSGLLKKVIFWLKSE